MNKIFRKAITVLSSVALVGATVAAASAAAYPSPFTSNTAVVYPSSSAAAPSDETAAGWILSNLNLAGGSGSVTGETFLIKDGSDNLNLGDTLDFAGTLNDEDMENFLVSGKYKDINRDEWTYDQTIDVEAQTLEFFSDSSYKDKEPTIGLAYSRGATVLTYEIDFNGLNLTRSIGTDLPMMNSLYYVLDYSSTKLTLLDSSASSMINEGETKTINLNGKSYDVTVDYVSLTGSTENTKLIINGETTDKLNENDDYELDDGAYVAIKEIVYSSKESGISKVELTIGKGKLELPVGGTEIEINDVRVKGVRSTITGNDTISIEWRTDAKTFLTENGDEMLLPGLETLKLIYGGIEFPSAEKTTLDADDIFELQTAVKDGSVSIPLFDRGNITSALGNLTYLGEAYDNRLITNFTAGTNVTLELGDYFVATYISSNAKEYYSYVYELDSVTEDTSTSKIEVVLKNLAGGDDVTFAQVGRDRTKNKLKMTLLDANATSTAEEAVISLTATDTQPIMIHKLITNKGLLIDLPTLGSTNLTAGVELTFVEADEDAVAMGGKNFTVTVVDDTADSEIHVSGVAGGTTGDVTEKETTTNDVYNGYVNSELATMYMWDKSGDSNDFEVSYFGEEVSAKVYVASATASLEKGAIVLKDTDTAAMAGKNLVVVGGSAINAIAAELLGAAYSEGAFTVATGVDAGKFLIESFDRAGKRALLVAGYNAADTEKAATYLINKGSEIDTTVGNRYVGRSETEATLVVA